MSNKELCVHSWEYQLISFAEYDARVREIKQNKSKSERKIRLRVFKRLSKEAINEIPKNLIKANVDRRKANDDWKKANADCEKAYADREKAYADWDKAYADWKEKDEWHKKYCGCKEWNGKELVFEK